MENETQFSISPFIIQRQLLKTILIAMRNEPSRSLVSKCTRAIAKRFSERLDAGGAGSPRQIWTHQNLSKNHSFIN